MFRCENCGEVPEKNLKANTQENKFVVESKPKIYTHVKVVREDGKKIRTEFKTEGTEIVKEISTCNDCFEKLENGEIVYGNKNGNGKRNQRVKIGDSTIKKRRKVV